MEGDHLADLGLQGRERTGKAAVGEVANLGENLPDSVGLTDALFQHRFADAGADRLLDRRFNPSELALDEVDDADRDAQPGGSPLDGLARLAEVAAIRELPPDRLDSQVGHPLHQGGKIIAAGARRGNDEIRPWKVGPVDERGERRPGRTGLLPETEASGQAKQPLVHLHKAGKPPGPVRVEGDGVGAGKGDDRGRPQVLERADNLPARPPGLMEPVFFG